MSLRPPKASPLVPGYRLDRYELLCPVAQGGMASVWVARMVGKHGFEKLVAIKTILPQYAEDERFQQMFLDEAHIAAGIEHPNVAHILDLGEEHGVLYLAMEWIDGDSLAKLQRVVEKKNLAIPLGITLRVLADVCGGLHAAHELRDKNGTALGVVHRDVSPQNVLVNMKGVAKLIDFGVAKARDRLAGDTNAGMVKGKVHYMAPEQAVGKPIDRRADVWGIGAVLYHLLSGRPAFEGPNQLATLHRLASGNPPLPLPETVPACVAELVSAAMAFDPDKRIPTAHDLQLRIEAAMAQADARASSADVAVFLREHVADRADARRKAIDVALAAASDRAKLQTVLQLDPDSSSGLVDVPKRLSATQVAAAPVGASEPPTMPALPLKQASSPSLMALDADTPPVLRDRSPRQRTVAIVAGTTVVAALLLAFALGRRSSGGDHASAGAGSEPAVTTTATVTQTATATATATTLAETATAPTASATTTAAPTPTTTGTTLATTTAPKPKTKASATATTKPKTKKPIDDGF